MTDIRIRPAAEADLPALLAIYNHAVEHSAATFDLQPRTEEEGRRWMAQHVGKHPLWVAESGGQPVGYASLSTYRPMPAYADTAELSVYLHPSAQGRGIGQRLAESLIRHAREELHLHLLVSVITAGHSASIRLHEKLGFRYVGTLHEAGFKFGCYHSVVHYELPL